MLPPEMQSKTNKRRKCDAAVVVAAIKLFALKIGLAKQAEAADSQDEVEVEAGQMLWLLFAKSNCKFYVTPAGQVDTQWGTVSG